MATFQKRGEKWRAIVRKKGYAPQSKSFSTKGMAQRWARETERDMEMGAYKDLRRLDDETVGGLIRRFRAEFPKIGRTKDASLSLLDREIGQVTLTELTKQRILAFARHRANDHGAGPSTVAQDLIYLRGILNTARAHWDIPVGIEVVADASAILRKQGLVGRSVERERRVSEDELDRLSAYWAKPTSRKPGAPMWDIVRFAIATTMRLSEITRLAWCDLDEGDRTIVIRERKHPDPEKKIANSQIVPLLGESFAIVKAQPGTGSRIFPFNPRSLSANFTRAVMRCGIEDLHFHDLRHEGISRLFEAGYQIHEVALMSGHRDWKQLARYTQIKAKDLHRSIGNEQA